jgi:co-chaperonin GroES (HSP10)
LFQPVNRYVLIEVLEDTQEEDDFSGFVVPDEFAPAKPTHSAARVLKTAPDCRFELLAGSKIIINRSMVEEISIGSSTWSVILDNYIIGIL